MNENDEYEKSELVPKLVLNNSEKIPIIGLRTCSSHQGNVSQAVMDAIDSGYRHFDCVDLNEHEVGKGVKAKIDECVVRREDLFITSKLWYTFHSPELVRGECEATLKNLGLEYVDMYLWHWPLDSIPNFWEPVKYVAIWKEMEKLVDAKLAKCIGLSNFIDLQILAILDVARIQPATNQIECHPYINQNYLMEFCKNRNIAITAYSPLGGSRSNLLAHEKIKNIARCYEKTPAQILIRYQLDRGNIVIPQSQNKEHMKSNLDVFGFKLTAEEEENIESIIGG